MTGYLPAADQAARRLGQRLPLSEVRGEVLLEVGRWRHRVRRVPVAVADASVTGLGLVGDLPADIGAGRILRFELNGVASAVRVRHVSPVPTLTGTFCGVEFIEPYPAVLLEIHRLRNGGVTPTSDQVWWAGLVR